MERRRFDMGIGKIQEVFPQFKTARANLIWDRFKECSDDDWGECVDDIVGNNRYTPTLDEFRTRLTPKMNKDKEVFCTFCDSTGVITKYILDKCPIELKLKPFSCAFKCNCANADGLALPSLRNFMLSGHKTISDMVVREWKANKRKHITQKDLVDEAELQDMF